MLVSPLISSLLGFVLAVFLIEITQKIRKISSVISFVVICMALALSVMIGAQTTKPESAGGNLGLFWLAYAAFCLFVRKKSTAADKVPSSNSSGTAPYPKDVINRIAEEGDLACEANVPRSANPYKAPNTEQENLAFASYWDRGYTVAEKRMKREGRYANAA